MPLRAVLFDVGDTLVQHWKPQVEVLALTREALRHRFGDRPWYDGFLTAEIAPARDAPTVDPLKQETNRWYEEWFRNSQVGLDDIDVDHLRIAVTVPLDLVGELVPGTESALRWCKEKRLAVVLVTNTLSRGDEEVWEDWRRFGLKDLIDEVVSSHSVGWQKPHAEIFRRALERSRTRPEEAVMVGDRMLQDVWGAKQLGLRAVWRRPMAGAPQEPVDTLPDAVVDDLTELPAILEPWL